MARPTKLTPELQAKICDAIRAGNYIETASAYAGIHKSTIYDWMRKGENAKSGKFHQFSNAIQKALADAEVRDVAIIGNAAKINWQAAAWRLERKFPDKWGRKDKVSADLNHSGKVDHEHEHNHTITGRIEQYEKIYENIADQGDHEGDDS